MKVSFWHLKAIGYCNRELRVWCKSHGLSFKQLVNEGIDSDYLLSIDSSQYALDAISFAESTGWSETPVSSDNDDCNARCV